MRHIVYSFSGLFTLPRTNQLCWILFGFSLRACRAVDRIITIAIAKLTLTVLLFQQIKARIQKDERITKQGQTKMPRNRNMAVRIFEFSC